MLIASCGVAFGWFRAGWVITEDALSTRPSSFPFPSSPRAIVPPSYRPGVLHCLVGTSPGVLRRLVGSLWPVHVFVNSPFYTASWPIANGFAVGPSL